MSTYVEPRIRHNADLTQALIARLKVTARYPRVTEQVPALPLDVAKLVKWAYNPSIIEHDGCLLMAYRYHDGDTLATKLALAQVSFEGEVISNRTLEMGNGNISVEDPKLFLMDGDIWICWVQSTWPNVPVASVVKYGRLDGNKVVNVHQPTPPQPKAIEKNWCPVVTERGELYFIYEAEPKQIVFRVDNDTITETLTAPAPAWCYGVIRGGTPPVPYKGKLLRFFHSGLDNEFDGWRRRYFVGACLMDPVAPFAPVAVSSRPIVFGSEVDGLLREDRSKCRQYKGRVVFPGGAVERHGEFILAVGINDSACALLRISPESLNL